jgi:biotin transport system substrate-specific component
LALLSVFAYLIEGSLGLPVFAGGLMTLGYRFAFLPAAWVMGKMVEGNFSFSRIVVASTVSTGLVLVLGAAWLGVFIGVSPAITAGVLPFLAGSIAKIFLGAVILNGYRRLV